MTIFKIIRKFKEGMLLKGFNLSDLSRETGVWGLCPFEPKYSVKKFPSPKLAKKMAEVLQVEVNELFFEFEVKEA
ncbi:transcriptional regulator [Staphylococcus aureus]